MAKRKRGGTTLRTHVKKTLPPVLSATAGLVGSRVISDLATRYLGGTIGGGRWLGIGVAALLGTAIPVALGRQLGHGNAIAFGSGCYIVAVGDLVRQLAPPSWTFLEGPWPLSPMGPRAHLPAGNGGMVRGSYVQAPGMSGYPWGRSMYRGTYVGR